MMKCAVGSDDDAVELPFPVAAREAAGLVAAPRRSGRRRHVAAIPAGGGNYL